LLQSKIFYSHEIKKVSRETLILRPPALSVGIGCKREAMRENQNISFTTLKEFDTAHVDMQTVIFIGSSTSLRYIDFLFTQGVMERSMRYENSFIKPVTTSWNRYMQQTYKRQHSRYWKGKL